MNEKLLTSIARLSPAERQVLESLLGDSLASEDMLFLAVMRPGREPGASAKARARARLERVFDQVDRFGSEHNVSSEESDAAIDAAVDDYRSRQT